MKIETQPQNSKMEVREPSAPVQQDINPVDGKPIYHANEEAE